jgi:hypothetical protein
MVTVIGPISQREYWALWDKANGIKPPTPRKPKKARKPPPKQK